MKLRKLFVFIIIMNLLLNTSISYALNLDDLFNKKSSVDQKKGQLQTQIQQIQKQKKTIEQQLGSIDDKLDAVQNNLNNLNIKLANNQSKINFLQKDIDKTTTDMVSRQKILETRLKVFYENGEVTYLDVLFNSDSFTDFLSRMDIIKQIASYDKNLLAEMEQTKIDLNNKKTDLETTKKQIEESKKESELLKKQQLDIKNQKTQVMNQLTAEQKKAEEEYDQEMQASNAIAEQIRNAQNSTKNSPYTGGTMMWPAPGYYTVTSPFGYRVHPILKVNKMHTGIDISVPSGSRVVAANDGTVIYASWMSGYGNAVVIDHGGGLSTLYAHNTSLLVSVGQKVTKGQQIAKSGSTGNSTGPHVHFEVRSNGNPVNPMSYVK